MERVFCGEKERDYWKAMRGKCPNTEVFLVRTFPRKEAHAAITSALLLVSLAEERSSSSRMFMYWMTILKLKIDYLVFIRSMTKDNFNVFVKILIYLVKCFFIFDHYNSPSTFKICWIYPSHGSTLSITWKRKFCGTDFRQTIFTNLFWPSL